MRHDYSVVNEGGMTRLAEPNRSDVGMRNKRLPPPGTPQRGEPDGVQPRVCQALHNRDVTDTAVVWIPGLHEPNSSAAADARTSSG